MWCFAYVPDLGDFGDLSLFQSTHGVWVRDLTTVTCVAVNHRYRLLAFGVERSLVVDLVFDSLLIFLFCFLMILVLS